ncbi:hypothetical protein KB1_22550 [Cutibacterium modestum]|uniref:Uncharacterized protein n=1 Tax=Cutibacterium modestum TaxID=2559073 RepID=A0AAD1KS83_9ACTN|nr:hypothetical protein KB1_22550 [Cutibacterium modestum]
MPLASGRAKEFVHGIDPNKGQCRPQDITWGRHVSVHAVATFMHVHHTGLTASPRIQGLAVIGDRGPLPISPTPGGVGIDLI